MHHKMVNKKIFNAKNVLQDRFFQETKCAAGKISQTKWATGQILALNPDG